MAEESTIYDQIKESVVGLSQNDYLSTIYDPQLKQDLLQTKFNMINYKIQMGKWNNDTDPYEAAQQLNNEMFPNQYVIDTGKRLNFAVDKEIFEKQADLDPDKALSGANLLIANMDELNADGQAFKWGIFKEIGDDYQKMMPEKELEKRKKELELAGILHGKDTENYLREQATQDIIDGNSYNLERALIPDSSGEGYRIGIFYIPEDGSSKDGILIGAMLDGNKFRHISHQELLGASASEHFMEYVTSNYFNYSHKNVQKLKDEGIETDEKYSWKTQRVSDYYPQFFEEMGQLEFQYVLKPLSDMLDKKATEKFGKKYRPGVDFLSDAESQTVLESYMDRLDRFYKSDYVPDVLKPTVRSISNWWSVDFSVRELFYED